MKKLFILLIIFTITLGNSSELFALEKTSNLLQNKPTKLEANSITIKFSYPEDEESLIFNDLNSQQIDAVLSDFARHLYLKIVNKNSKTLFYDKSIIETFSKSRSINLNKINIIFTENNKTFVINNGISTIEPIKKYNMERKLNKINKSFIESFHKFNPIHGLHIPVPLYTKYKITLFAKVDWAGQKGFFYKEPRVKHLSGHNFDEDIKKGIDRGQKRSYVFFVDSDNNYFPISFSAYYRLNLNTSTEDTIYESQY